MRALALVGALALGCGPSYGKNEVKTPDQLLEERLAGTDGETGSASVSGEEETDADRKRKFDERQAELELKRAQRSAETCVGVVTESGPKGTAKVHLTFGNDGKVKDSKIDPPFDGTALGKCALRAMAAVIVPPYAGDEVTKEWELDLSGEKK